MAGFPPEVIDAAARQREVTLTTTGRKSGRDRSVRIWISTEGNRLFVRSGGGMRRDWPQNLMARGEATLGIGGKTIGVKPRQITDPSEARAVSGFVRKKYGFMVRASKPTEPLTPGEQATFELIPAQ